MKLCVKRIFCANCRRLVRCREEPVNGKINIVCSRCGTIIWIKNPVTWQYANIRKEESDSGEAETAQTVQQKQQK